MNGSITKTPLKGGKISWGYYFVSKNEGKKRDQFTKQGFDTKREAEEELRKAIASHAANPNERDPRTFAEFFDSWIKEHCERNCEPTTVEGYLKKGAYAKTHFGKVRLNALTALQIERALNALRDHGGKKTKAHPLGRPLSAKTVREVAAIINATFRAAIRWGVLTFNPMSRVTLPRANKIEPRVLEKLDIESVLSACKGHEWLYPLLLLDVATGCRRGELLALTWADIDVANRVMSVSKAYAQTKTRGVYLKVPKGRKARRFSLSQSSIAALEMHRQAQLERRAMFGEGYRADPDLVFADESGEVLKPDSVTAKVSRLARQLGFPKGVSLHTLRHSHGSHLLSNGVRCPRSQNGLVMPIHTSRPPSTHTLLR